MAVEIRSLCKAFGAHKVLENFCATLPESGVVEVCGRSGAGKTTLFRILLGLETADSGEIAGLEGWRLGAVFQEDRLRPHRSAVDNVRFVCGASEAEILSHLEQVVHPCSSRTANSHTLAMTKCKIFQLLNGMSDGMSKIQPGTDSLFCRIFLYHMPFDLTAAGYHPQKCRIVFFTDFSLMCA